MRSLRIISSTSLNNLQTFLQVYSLAEQATTKVVETKSKCKERLHEKSSIRVQSGLVTWKLRSGKCIESSLGC